MTCKLTVRMLSSVGDKTCFCSLQKAELTPSLLAVIAKGQEQVTVITSSHCSQWYKRTVFPLTASEIPTEVPCEVFT